MNKPAQELRENLRVLFEQFERENKLRVVSCNVLWADTMDEPSLVLTLTIDLVNPK